MTTFQASDEKKKARFGVIRLKWGTLVFMYFFDYIYPPSTLGL